MSTRQVSLGDQLTLMELYIYIVICFYVAVVILIQFGKAQQTIAYWLSFLLFSVILIVDAAMFATHDQLHDFYLPFVIIVLIITLIKIMDFCTVPQRFCEEVRFFQIYFTS